MKYKQLFVDICCVKFQFPVLFVFITYIQNLSILMYAVYAYKVL